MDKKVLVVGTGLMGAGIAQACAEAGVKTFITDVSVEVAEKGLANIRHFLKRKVEKGKISEEKYEELAGNITIAANYADAGRVDFAIEVVSENLELKKKIFAALDEA